MNDLQELIKRYLELKNLGAFENQLNFIIALTGGISAIGASIFKITKWFKAYLKKRRLVKDLSPFYSQNEIENSLQYFVATKCQNVSPSIVQEPGHSYPFSTSEKLIPFFKKKAFKNKYNDCKYFIILADSGMGKTTFMINLFLSYTKRSLLKVLLGEIFFEKKRIKLFPLGHPKVSEKLVSVEKKNETILLLDAFDEDNKAIINIKERLNEIIDLVWEFRIVIITCRTQFFPSEQEEPYKTGLLKYGSQKGEHLFGKLYISPFDDADIRKYLRKRYPLYKIIVTKADWSIDLIISIVTIKNMPKIISKRQRAWDIVSKSPNLMVRPMLLNYIDELIKGDAHFKFSFQIYEALIDKWFDREASRYNDSGISKLILHNFSLELAKNIFLNRQKRGGLYIKVNELEEFALGYKITLSKIEMTSKSLLNRTSEGLYKFSHKSILEYFLALEGYANPSFIKNNSFNDLENVRLFLKEMGLFKSIRHFFKTYPSFNLFCCKTDGGLFQFYLSDLTTEIIEHIVYIKFDETFLTSPELKQFVIAFTALKMFSDDKTDMPTFSIYFQKILKSLEVMNEKIHKLEVIGLEKLDENELREYHELKNNVIDKLDEKFRYEERFKSFLEFDRKLRWALDKN